MRRWWQVGTRNWRAKPVRTLLAVSAVALGVGLVTWVTCCYESGRVSLESMITDWIGRAQISIESVAGRWQLFDAKVAEGLDRQPNVRRMTLRTIETVDGWWGGEKGLDTPLPRIDLVGIEPQREADFRSYTLSEGRLPRADEADAVAVELLLAREYGMRVGDLITFKYRAAETTFQPLRIVGLVDRRRVSSHQLPMAWTTLSVVQRGAEFAGQVKSIDLILEDDSEAAITETAEKLRKIVRGRDPTLKVNTTIAQLRQLRSAQSQLQFLLMLISCVALMTAFFIILSTMSMGVSERIAQLGMLRCVGVTRGQLLAMVLLEVAPLGVVGVLIGVPIGLALQALTIRLVPDYLGQATISGPGVALAVAGGLLTPLLGALGPAIWAARLSPIEASRSAPQRHSWRVEFLAAIGGMICIAAHFALVRAITSETPNFRALAIGALALMYAGYTLITPLLVVLLGGAQVRVAAWLLRLRRQLVNDQVGRRPWRSGAVCCGIMVGLSLIVALQVHGESVKSGWEFPTQFPEAMIYSWSDVPLERMREAAQTAGVRNATIAADIRCKLAGKRRGFLSALDPFYRFIAGDPETFPSLIRLVYLEGNEADALVRLKRGGAILVTREFSLARKIHLNDRVTLEVGDLTHTFEVAGVVASPALDIAVSFFGASGEFQVYAVGSFIGTLADAERLFGQRSARLLLFNFELPETERHAYSPFTGLRQRPGAGPPTETVEPAPESVGHLRAAAAAAGTADERSIANAMIAKLKSTDCAYVTARELKRKIDENIDDATTMLAAIPLVGLIVSALGVANLMMANVAHRVRQIAVLRAVGATKFQVCRLVVAEALILGAMGCALGLVMGMHLGMVSNYFTATIWGFEPKLAVPWGMVAAGAGLAVGLCLLAGIFPARVASRDNIVATLQTA